jgi:hypothetical protein
MGRSFAIVVLVAAGCVGTAESRPAPDPGPGVRDAGEVDAGAFEQDASEPVEVDSGTEPLPSTDAGTAPTPDAGGSTPHDAGSIPPTTGPLDEASVFFIGHSLVNHDMPSMLDCVARDLARRHAYRSHIGIGASLSWIHTHPERGEGPNPQIALRDGTEGILVMTEAIPLLDNYRYNDTVGYASRFAEIALAARADTRVYVYETWHFRRDAGWREQLRSDRALWERIVTELDARVGGAEVLLVPGGTALGALVDEARAGRAGGVQESQIFSDDIHMTSLGNYFIALVHYAVLYRRSPEGATGACRNRFGNPFPVIPAEAAAAMQSIAWGVVANDTHAGVRAR